MEWLYKIFAGSWVLFGLWTLVKPQALARRLKRLATSWRVSQAEVVRRAVAAAEEQAAGEGDAAAGLRGLHASGDLLVREEAEAYLADVREDRNAWRRGS